MTKVTADVWSRVRWRAYVMKLARGGGEAGGTVVERGGRSGHANKCVTNRAQVRYRPWPFKALEEVEGGEGDGGRARCGFGSGRQRDVMRGSREEREVRTCKHIHDEPRADLEGGVTCRAGWANGEREGVASVLG